MKIPILKAFIVILAALSAVGFSSAKGFQIIQQDTSEYNESDTIDLSKFYTQEVIDIYYCRINNPVLMNILRERIEEIDKADLKKQKTASIYYGFKIDFNPIDLFPTRIDDFKKKNFYTLVNDSVGVILGDQDSEFFRLWIDVDSSRVYKCNVYISHGVNEITLGCDDK